MIQDIAPARLANEYLPDATPEPGDVVAFVRGQDIAVHLVGDAPIATFELPLVGVDVGEALLADLTYLFEIGGTRVWLAPDCGRAEVPAGFELTHNRTLRLERRGTHEQMYLVYTAVHLAGWYASNRFCGTCGSAMRRHDTLRALSCPSCGALVFPRLNPAVIVCVRDPERNRIVLTRYADGRYAPIDALVAGFVEIGETLEECVRREVREELGIAVKNIEYYKSQPWGVAGDVLAGFWCDVDGDPTLHMDAEELGRAAWVAPEDIAGQGDDLSLTNEMMCRWRDEHASR